MLPSVAQFLRSNLGLDDDPASYGAPEPPAQPASQDWDAAQRPSTPSDWSQPVQPQSSYNDPDAGGTIIQPLLPQEPSYTLQDGRTAPPTQNPTWEPATNLTQPQRPPVADPGQWLAEDSVSTPPQTTAQRVQEMRIPEAQVRHGPELPSVEPYRPRGMPDAPMPDRPSFDPIATLEGYGEPGRKLAAELRRAGRDPSYTVDPWAVYEAIASIPFEVVSRARRELIPDKEAVRAAGTDPVAPFRPVAESAGITLPSAQELNPEGRPASDIGITAGLTAVAPDPFDPAANAALRGAGRVLGAGARAVGAAGRAAGRSARGGTRVPGQRASAVPDATEAGLRGVMQAPSTGSAAGVVDDVLESQAPRALPAPAPRLALPEPQPSTVSFEDFARAADSPEQKAAREAASRPYIRPDDPPALREAFGRPWEEVAPIGPGRMDVTGEATRQLVGEGTGVRRTAQEQVLPVERAQISGPVRIEPQSLNLNSVGAGLVGAGAGTELDEDGNPVGVDPYTAGAGALALGILGRRGKGGAKTVLRAADSANPTIRDLDRQMRGNYRPSGVSARPLGERIVAALTDKNAISANVENEVKARVRATGAPDPASRLAERVRVNPNSIAAQRAREELAPALQKIGDDIDWTEQYLVHRHNLDVAKAKGLEAYDEAIAAGRSPARAAAIQKRVEESRAFGGGVTTKEITQALADMQVEIGPVRFKAVVDTAQAFWDTGRKSLDASLAEGLIDPARHTLLTTRYPHYVRTDIADYFERGPSGPRSGRTMGLSDIGIKAISREGSAKDRVNPILSTIDALYSHEQALVRNAAGRDLATLRDADPTARALFKEVAPDVKAYAKGRAEMVPPDYSLRGGEQKLTVWDGGTARQFVVPGEYAQLLTPPGGVFLGDAALAQGTRTFFGIWKSLLTTHNPGFQLLVSPIRDAADAIPGEAIRSATKPGAMGAAQAVGQLLPVVVDYARALPAAFEGFGRNRVGAEVAALRRAGAGFDPRPPRTDKGLRGAMGDLQRTGGMPVQSAADAARAARTILTLGAEPIGSRLELVPRIMAARRAAGRGADPMGQAMAFKDSTIDYLRGGWLVQQLNVPVPFMNPTVQSAAQVGRLMKRNPAAFTAAVATGIGVPAMLADAWNRSDEQRARDYEDVPNYIKNGGIVWMLPKPEGTGELGERKPNYIFQPLGSFAFVARLAREGLALADPITGLKSDTPTPASDRSDPAYWAGLGADILGMFSPVKGDSAASSVASLIPPVASEVMEVGFNQDFYRGNKVATDRRDENASNLSKGIASGINTLTGGDQVRPSQVEHVTRGVGGYGANLANEAADRLTGREKKETRPVQDVPFVGGIAGRIVRDASGQRLENEVGAAISPAVRQALGQAGIRTDQLAMPESNIRDMPITRQEQAVYQREFNALLDKSVREALADPEWKSASAVERERWVKNLVTSARNEAAGGVVDTWDDATIDRRTDKRAEKRMGVR